MKTKKQMLRSLIALAVVAAMVLFAFFVVAEAGHDCDGDGCAVCSQIAACVQVLEQALYAILVMLVMAACRAAGVYYRHTAHIVRNNTLVSLKAKLSN